MPKSEILAVLKQHVSVKVFIYQITEHKLCGFICGARGREGGQPCCTDVCFVVQSVLQVEISCAISASNKVLKQRMTGNCQVAKNTVWRC